MRISVIVATLGRESLKKCIESWLSQTLAPFELIIIADGPGAKLSTEKILSKIDLSKTKVTLVGNLQKLGASASYNLALDIAVGDAVALTSDDDVWLPKKLELQTRALLETKNSVVLTGAFYRRNKNWIIRPRTVISNDVDPLIEVFYQRTFPWTAAKYIPMSSILFKSTVSGIRFDESLEGYEDFSWLHSAFHNGFKITQLKEPLIWVETNLKRSSARKLAIESPFIEELDSIKFGLRERFLTSHFIRPFIYEGNLAKVLEIRTSAYRNRSKSPHNYFDALWQYILTSGIFISKAILGWRGSKKNYE